MAQKKIKGFVICHGHMDIEWYMPLHSFRFWITEALDELRRINAEQPDFAPYVLDGATCVLDIYFDARPEAKEDIKKLISGGKLIIGPFYSQFDEWLPCAESIVRNCLYGNRQCRKYGKIMKAGYLPDNFGHPLQMPQILNNFGIDSLLFMRGMPEIQGGHPDEFIYKGIDGSKVLASHFRGTYDGAFGEGAFDVLGKNIDPMQPRDMPYYHGYYSYEYFVELADHMDKRKIAVELIRNVRNIRNRYPSGLIPLMAGCDHCPPQRKISEIIELANNMQDEIEFVAGDAEEYIREVQASGTEMMTFDKELTGSFYQYILFGTLSSRSYLKRRHFGAEALMVRYTEPLDAIASIFGYSGTQPQLDEAWKYLNLNSAHDSIHGSSVDEVHNEMETRYAAVGQIAAGLSHNALKYIGSQMNPWWNEKGRGILAFAPSDPGVPQLGQVWLPIGDDRVCIFDNSGNALPTQVLPRETIEINGKGMPRNAYQPHKKLRNVLFLANSEANMINSFVCVAADVAFEDIKAADDFIENEYLRVEIKGALINILDKSTGVWYYGLNLIEENKDAGDAWDYSPAWIPGETVLSSRFCFNSRLVEKGPVRAVVESSGIMNVPFRLIGDERSKERVDLPVCFAISLERYSRRVDVRLTLENTAKDHRIRLRIPSGVKSDTVISQGHFAIIERPVERVREVDSWKQPPTQMLPFTEWLAVNDGKTGLAIAVKGIYDYEAVMNPISRQTDIYLTLLRGFEYMNRINTMQRFDTESNVNASDCFHTPGAQCPGRHVIEWAYVPYKVDRNNKAPFLPTVQGFLYPMMTHMVRSEQVGNAAGKEILPFVFLNDNVQFSSFKRSYDGDGFILRFYENQGKNVKAAVRLKYFNRVFMSNMNEESLQEIEMKDNTVCLKVDAYKVITLLLKKKPYAGL